MRGKSRSIVTRKVEKEIAGTQLGSREILATMYVNERYNEPPKMAEMLSKQYNIIRQIPTLYKRLRTYFKS